ncbi:MAG: recombination protein RecR [Parcubacteria group bacterium CG11_big_fil_rev_8_21_14_0_20_39_22]|nr:MAG: recombination protein RecR [Parcubacteria group bacterium CG11_big_fil_rev_8_21_14_0_20_39_22]
MTTSKMTKIEKLTELFRQFPGIGPRQAQRFVYFLLSMRSEDLSELSETIGSLSKEVSQCSSCFRFFPAVENRYKCEICSDTSRDNSLLFIVAKDVDLESVEKSRTYGGLYFVTGGTLPLNEKNPDNKIRLKNLIDRTNTESQNLREIILGFNLNAEGEHTSSYIEEKIGPIAAKKGIKISFLARGLSTGAELEYADSTTLKNALKNRT